MIIKTQVTAVLTLTEDPHASGQDKLFLTL